MGSKRDDAQRKRFTDAAREVGADEDPEAFKERLKKLVKTPAGKKQDTAKRGRDE